MSGNSWVECPRCKDRREAKFAIADAAIAAQYGKVTVEEFDRMRNANEKAKKSARTSIMQDTFREDYKFVGVSDGTVTASYVGHCSACNLHVEFTYDHPFYPEVRP